MAKSKKGRFQPPVVNNFFVKYFRGIADEQTINFNEKGKVIILYGENGTGKSSFVNAFEYLFKGKLDLLKSQSIDKKQHPQFHYGSLDEDWGIKLTFKGNKYISRNSNGFEADKNTKKIINANKSFFENTSFILNRKKLLEFIETTDGKRFESISKLCGFDDITPIQKTLNQTEKYFMDLIKQKDNHLINIKKEIADILNIDEFSNDNEIYDKINKELYNLNKDAIDENTNLNEYIDNFDTFHDIYLFNRSIEEFKKVYGSLDLEGLYDDFKEILDKYDKLGIESISNIKQLENILVKSKSYIDLTNNDKCPVCERELNKEILNSIDSRLNTFENNLKSFNNLENEIKSFKLSLNEKIYNFDKIIDILKNISINLNLDNELKFVENSRNDFKNLSNDLDNLINFNTSVLELSEKYDLNISDEFKIIEEKLIIFDETDKNSNYLKLKDIEKCIKKLIKIKTINDDISKLNSKHELAYKFQYDFNVSKMGYINNLIDEIEEDVDTFYKFIHGDDEISSFDMELRDVSLLRFYVNSFGEKADPRSFSSEGHLDSLGLCIFLAFMKKFNPFNFIVLDDVITSVDLSHKDKIARLIVSKFNSYKILITTHNPLWAEQLQRICEGHGRTSEIMQITNWELGVGPSIKNHNNTPETIRKFLNDNEYNAAVNTSRRFLEYLLTTFCENHSVNLKLRDRYSVGDLKNPVYVKSKEIVKGTNLDEYLKYLWKEFGLYEYIGNKLSHHNKDAYLLTGSEVVPFCNLVIELNKVLNHCIGCRYGSELIFDKYTLEVECSDRCKFK